MHSTEIVRVILLYIPLSVIGLWRWSFWAVRSICARLYRPNILPKPAGYKNPTISVVTPVYNEDPVVFEEAMQSWLANGVDEIVAVIDKSNTSHIVNFFKNYVDNPKYPKTKCRMVVTPKPGKRAALCDGIEAATGDLIALVDSDTIWSLDLVEKSLPYFHDEKVGAATYAQRLQNPYTTANVLFDLLLYSRYKEEVPFLLATGKTFNTLSGRTAMYRREAIFNKKHDNIHMLRHEFFFGTRGVSGDDKRLTHLIVEQGWQTTYVLGPVVLTPGLNSMKKFLKQRLRWTRNSWRNDLRAVGRGWVFAHPALALFIIDRFFQPIFMLVGPVAMVFALASGRWKIALVLYAWWLVSRVFRVFGYFWAHPKRLAYLPAYITYGHVNALIKVYALATLIENSWATRWNKGRAKRKSIFRRGYTLTSGSLATIIFLVLVSQIVVSLRKQSGLTIPVISSIDHQSFIKKVTAKKSETAVAQLPAGSITPSEVAIYDVQRGDNLTVLAQRFGMTVSDLRKVNGLGTSEIYVGQSLIYYGTHQ